MDSWSEAGTAESVLFPWNLHYYYFVIIIIIIIIITIIIVIIIIKFIFIRNKP